MKQPKHYAVPEEVAKRLEQVNEMERTSWRQASAIALLALVLGDHAYDLPAGIEAVSDDEFVHHIRLTIVETYVKDLIERADKYALGMQVECALHEDQSFTIDVKFIPDPKKPS